MSEAYSTLRRLSRRQAPPAAQRCDLCGAVIGSEHPHLADPDGKLACSCLACSLLFPARPGVRFKQVPRDVIELPADDRWSALSIPIGLAFFCRRSSDGGVLALYPSPAGPTPAAVDAEAWRILAEQTPELSRMEPDVQALLVHRLGGARDAFIVPIDRCYELVGRLKLKWRGISGGDEVRSELEQFFQSLREGRALRA